MIRVALLGFSLTALFFTVISQESTWAEKGTKSFLPPSIQRQIDGSRNVTYASEEYLALPHERSQTLMKLPGSSNFLVVEDMVPKTDDLRSIDVATKVSLIRPVRNKSGYISIKNSPVIKSVVFMVERDTSLGWKSLDTEIVTIDKTPVLMIDDCPGGNSNSPVSILVSLDPKTMFSVVGRAMFEDSEKKRSDEFGMPVRFGYSSFTDSHAEIPEVFIYCTIRNGVLTPHHARCQENWDGDIAYSEEKMAELLSKPASGNRNHVILYLLIRIALRQWLLGDEKMAQKTLLDGLNRISDGKGRVCLSGEDLSHLESVEETFKELQEWLME